MLMMKRSHEMDMCSGPLMKKLLLYCVPIIFTGVLHLLFNAADVIVVGRFAGRTALAAVGATTALTNLLVNLFMMMSVGVSVVVARHYGAHEFDEVGNTVTTAITFSGLTGIAVGLFGIVFARILLTLMDCPPDVLGQASLYMRIYFIGIPALMIYNFGAAALRAVGDTQRPLQFLTIAGIVNVLLNLLLVIVFKLGVAGVAIATAVSQYLSATFVLLCLIRMEGCLHLEIKDLCIDRFKLLEIIRIGLPAGIQSAVFGISNVMIQSSINSFGSAVVAANSASANIEGFTYTAMNAVTSAAMAFTGQNMGAKQYKRINEILAKCLLLVLLVGGGMCGLTILLAEPLISIYAKGDSEVVYWGVQRLLAICPLYCTLGINDVFVGVMRGTGFSAQPMLISIFGICGLRIVWLYTFYAYSPTFAVLLAGYPVSWIATLIMQACAYAIMYRRTLLPRIRAAAVEA